MNKKLLIILLVGVMTLAVVSAVSYYALATITLNVNQPIEISGELSQVVDCDSGDTCLGNVITISNDGSSSRLVTITDNSGDNIVTSYVGETNLYKKVVDFGNAPWDIYEDGQGMSQSVRVEYTIVGDEFTAIVPNSLAGYELIYYADNPDRFNNVAKAISVDAIDENLPYFDDENAEGGDYDYCAIEGYDTCHGAKIWYVPSDAVDENGNIDWSKASEFFFETELIQFNSDGEIIVYPDEVLDFKPLFDVDKYAPEGQRTLTITIA